MPYLLSTILLILLSSLWLARGLRRRAVRCQALASVARDLSPEFSTWENEGGRNLLP